MIAESSYRNLNNALPAELDMLLTEGAELDSRVGRCKELTAHMVTLYNPVERVAILPHRNANIFAQVAETVWLLAGRNDADWLSWYLPRALDFSDDGKTWRAAYGPRLRRWHAHNKRLDQLDVCQKLLAAERGTRRAVLSIWDPIQDLAAASRDIPCNDTIQFLEREGRLDMHVFVRSNDIWWGWSGINTFAWSVLLEAMAFWTHVQPGRLVTFAGSWHLYEPHWQRAQHVAAVPSVYSEHPYMENPRWQTPFAYMDGELKILFALEAKSRKGENIARKAVTIADPWLRTVALLLNVHNAIRNGRTVGHIRSLVSSLPENDLTLAASDWCHRTIFFPKKGSSHVA